MVNNGGRTINRMAGRTKPALQSRGIISVTRRYGVQHMTSLFPNIHEHVYDSINEGKVKMKLDRRDAGVKRSLVHSRVSVTSCFNSVSFFFSIYFALCTK